tara:strand:+ start:1082 stop:1633 length:552 start_codon:yes stop_codon:yes gene_type:complete
MNSKDYNLFSEAYAAVYTEQATTVTTVPPAGDSFRTGSNKAPKAPKLPAPKNSTTKKEDVDLYDLMKGYLIDEGFADTEQAAVAIMANMSEEWRNYIVEGPIGEFADKAARTLGSGVGAIERGIKDGPKYLMQKAKNVKSTFDTARERARDNTPPNVVKAKKPATPTAKPYNQGGPRLPGRDM